METVIKQETIAQEALRLLSPIPHDEWIEHYFTDEKGKCCVLGHYSRLKGNPQDYSNANCAGMSNDEAHATLVKFSNATRNYLANHHEQSYGDISHVNNAPNINGYTEPLIKDRVIHFLKDMVEAGY